MHEEAGRMEKTVLIIQELEGLGTIWLSETEAKAKVTDFYPLPSWCEAQFGSKVMFGFGGGKFKELTGIPDVSLHQTFTNKVWTSESFLNSNQKIRHLGGKGVTMNTMEIDEVSQRLHKWV